MLVGGVIGMIGDLCDVGECSFNEVDIVVEWIEWICG